MKLRFPQQVESLTGSRGEAAGGLGSKPAPVAHQPVGLGLAVGWEPLLLGELEGWLVAEVLCSPLKLLEVVVVLV